MYFYSFLIIVLMHSINAEDLIRRTKNGFIIGRSFQLGEFNKTVNAWLGVPFAEKPLNNLRFKRPVPIKDWSGVLKTDKEPLSCYQSGKIDISEDCLYLNIWTSQTTAKSAVIIW